MHGHGDPFKAIFTRPFIQFLLLVKLIQHCCFNLTGDSNRPYAYEEDQDENMQYDPTVRHGSASVYGPDGDGDPFKTIFTNPLFNSFC